MRILVDADACPGKHMIERAAKENDIEVIMYCDINHVLNSDYSTVKYLDSGFQSVDMYLINEAKAGDIIITQDYGVAALALGKKAYAINPKGYIYNDENMDRLLFERHLSAKVRRGGGKTTSHKKRTQEDDLRLYESIIKIVKRFFINS
ncbi:YaiI/YqxD family protein [Clostridium peptidivorans]|uniref:YaiI/YqxD family protein n=1 Tax=Clostridium peptidivorans TaxID=100174 RepID=UPI000BE26E65|nr:YaiI/YqxD family protein [Clostridium peptidivorans]